MSIPDTDIARVRRWVAEQNERIGEHIDEMRVEMDVDPRAITILECRPPWREDFGPEWTRQEIARLRYTKSRGVWTLYWPDRNSKFHRYDDLDPTPTIARLLAEIDTDPICTEPHVVEQDDEHVRRPRRRPELLDRRERRRWVLRVVHRRTEPASSGIGRTLRGRSPSLMNAASSTPVATQTPEPAGDYLCSFRAHSARSATSSARG